MRSFHAFALSPSLVALANPAAAQSENPAPTAEAADWTPLEAGFENVFDPYVPVPPGSSGAPRHGWLGVPDGFFTQEYHLAYSLTDRDGPDVHDALARFHIPVTRRLWLGMELSFYRETDDIDGVGDATVTTRYMIAESRDLSLNAGVAWRLPLGEESVGGGVFAATPQIAFWTDVGAGISLRGGIGYTFADNDGVDSLNMAAAVGQTLTPHDEAPLGDLSWYVSGNWAEPDDGSTFLSITPGLRTHLGGNLFLLTGVELPVVNVDDNFDQRVIVQLVKGF